MPGNTVLPLAIDDVGLPVELQISDRAARLILRIDSRQRVVRVVVPGGTTVASAAAFVQRHRGWLARQIAALPPAVPFADGQVVPVLGEPHRIVHVDRPTGIIRRQDGEIRVPCLGPHIARRVRDHLKAAARTEIAARVETKAAAIGRTAKQLVLRDTVSRWGSCSADGRLMFSWRLILAPEPVLDYVVAHEVAHLAHMNHGKRFWRTCESLTAAMTASRDWLRRYGHDLHRYG